MQWRHYKRRHYNGDGPRLYLMAMRTSPLQYRGAGFSMGKEWLFGAEVVDGVAAGYLKGVEANHGNYNR